MVQFDAVLKEIGECGRAQIVQYVLLCLAVFNAGLLSVDVVFFSARPKHHCSLEPNQTAAVRSLFPNTSSADLLPALLPFEDGSPSSCKAFRYPQPLASYATPGSNFSDFLARLGRANRSQVSCNQWTYATDVYGLTFVNEVRERLALFFYSSVTRKIFTPYCLEKQLYFETQDSMKRQLAHLAQQ